MSDQYMHLIGAEQVKSAGHNILLAAHDMVNVASSIHGALDRLERILETDRELRRSEHETS